MSYCVNCGVELEPSLKTCPLCQTEVINPKCPHDAGAPRPYSSHIARLNGRVERHYVAIVISILLAFSAGICIMVDVAYSEAADWSLFVAISLALTWIIFLAPNVFDRLPALWFVVIDVLAVLGFLYGLNLLTGDGRQWFIKIALPLVIAGGAISAVFLLVIKHHPLKPFVIAAWACACVGTIVIATEAILDAYRLSAVHFDWSFFAAVPCFTLTLILTVIARKNELQEAIIRRLHV